MDSRWNTIQSIILCKHQLWRRSCIYSHRQPHAYDMAMRLEFDAKWAYQDGSVIGRKKEGIAKLWAPTAKKVELLLYPINRSGCAYLIFRWCVANKESSYHRKYPWCLDFRFSNLSGMKTINIVSILNTTYWSDARSYSNATTAGRMRSAILSSRSSSFDWGLKVPMRLLGAWITLVKQWFTGMHLQDLTKSPTSGVDESLRGTYLGLARRNRQ